jgi:hypothetical protein
MHRASDNSIGMNGTIEDTSYGYYINIHDGLITSYGYSAPE